MIASLENLIFQKLNSFTVIAQNTIKSINSDTEGDLIGKDSKIVRGEMHYTQSRQPALSRI